MFFMRLVAGKQTANRQISGNFCLVSALISARKDCAQPPSGGIFVPGRGAAILKQHCLAVEATEDAPLILAMRQPPLGEPERPADMADGFVQPVGVKVLFARWQCSLLVLVAVEQIQYQRPAEEEEECDVEG
ncbi:MAG: hypothetical protein Q8J75_03085 [Rhodocyclaceae bacterium]|nr:hypothetical protein [Rhodocyclaceae bacterium]